MKRLIALCLLLAGVAFGQCVMCFRTAAAQQEERARVLNAGILVLGIPPFAILGGFVYLLYRRSNPAADSIESHASPEPADPLPLNR